MRPITRFTIAILILALSLPALAKINVDFDRDADFSGYKTYAWLPGTEAKSPLYHKRIMAAIDLRMEERGYTRVEGEADLYVLYHASLSTERYVDVDDFGYWGRWRGWGSTTIDVYDIKVGTLIVDILDGGSRDLIWRGAGDDSFTSKAEKNEKKINKIVGKMFRKFPPEK